MKICTKKHRNTGAQGGTEIRALYVLSLNNVQSISSYADARV